MTTDKLRSVFQFYLDWIKTNGCEPCRSEDCPEHLGHLAYMAKAAIDELVPAGRIEKAMRWLGFIQGCLVACKWFKLDDVKHSMPDEEKT